jgi:hypothetical protein
VDKSDGYCAKVIKSLNWVSLLAFPFPACFLNEALLRILDNDHLSEIWSALFFVWMTILIQIVKINNYFGQQVSEWCNLHHPQNSIYLFFSNRWVFQTMTYSIFSDKKQPL